MNIFRSFFLRPSLTLAWSILNSIEIRYYNSTIGNSLDRLKSFVIAQLGSNVDSTALIRSHALVTTFSNLAIGPHSKVGRNCSIYSFAPVNIGSNVEIGESLIIHTNEHVISDPALPLTKQGVRCTAVSIADNVYIGSRVTILAGTTIEDRVVVAAGSLVRGTLKSGGCYAGVPAVLKKLL